MVLSIFWIQILSSSRNCYRNSFFTILTRITSKILRCYSLMELKNLFKYVFLAWNRVKWMTINKSMRLWFMCRGWRREWWEWERVREWEWGAGGGIGGAVVNIKIEVRYNVVSLRFTNSLFSSQTDRILCACVGLVVELNIDTKGPSSNLSWPLNFRLMFYKRG